MMARATIGRRDSHDLPHDTIRTTKGRVIYYRKKRVMSAKDLWRMAKALEFPTEPWQIVYYVRLILVLWSKMVLPGLEIPERVERFLLARLSKVLQHMGLDPQTYGIEAELPDEGAEPPLAVPLFTWPPWKPPFPTEVPE